jgi:nitrite reductase/ring-hydroxylating ferredoxin subunit
MTKVGPADELTPGSVKRAGKYAVGNNGDYFAVTRKCRHLGGPLDEGSIDADGCLVCPWHASKYDVKTGRMVRGPQGVYAKIPGLGSFFKTLTRVVPLGRATVEDRNGDLYLVDKG